MMVVLTDPKSWPSTLNPPESDYRPMASCTPAHLQSALVHQSAFNPVQAASRMKVTAELHITMSCLGHKIHGIEVGWRNRRKEKAQNSLCPRGKQPTALLKFIWILKTVCSLCLLLLFLSADWETHCILPGVIKIHQERIPQGGTNTSLKIILAHVLYHGSPIRKG